MSRKVLSAAAQARNWVSGANIRRPNSHATRGVLADGVSLIWACRVDKSNLAAKRIGGRCSSMTLGNIAAEIEAALIFAIVSPRSVWFKGK
jgi:hypothetical protein